MFLRPFVRDGRASLLMPLWLCSQSKEHFQSPRAAYQRALPTVSPAGLMALAILSTLIFVLHSHQRDKWFDRCTGTARGILMDTVFIHGFVSSRCKHTLCTHCFACRPSAQIRPNTRSWWFTSESYPSSSADRIYACVWGEVSVESPRWHAPNHFCQVWEWLVCLFGQFFSSQRVALAGEVGLEAFTQEPEDNLSSS